VDEAASTRYDEYKTELRARVDAGEGLYSLASMLELPDRHGFGFAVREALNHVTTSHVLIVQHDRSVLTRQHTGKGTSQCHISRRINVQCLHASMSPCLRVSVYWRLGVFSVS